MNIQTSYFAGRAPKERKVRISLKAYRFAPKLPNAALFAPSNPWAEDWQTAYRADLDSRFPTPESLRAALSAVCQETPDPILCCFEKNPDDCHRSVLAAYIREKLDLDIPEWQPSENDAPPAPGTPRAARKKTLKILGQHLLPLM